MCYRLTTTGNRDMKLINRITRFGRSSRNSLNKRQYNEGGGGGSGGGGGGWLKSKKMSLIKVADRGRNASLTCLLLGHWRRRKVEEGGRGRKRLEEAGRGWKRAFQAGNNMAKYERDSTTTATTTTTTTTTAAAVKCRLFQSPWNGAIQHPARWMPSTLTQRALIQLPPAN